jgi:large subunit ribosomal protein L5
MIKQHYLNVTRSDLLLKLKYKNILQIPKINKIVLNTSINNKNKIIEPLITLELITNQKAKILKARKSISSFNLRKDMYIACIVTLQNENMYDFLNKIINIALPRIREFKGLSLNSFDKRGNYMLPIKNLLVFPEIEYQFDIFNKIYGMDVIFVTNVRNKTETKLLLTSLGLPFKENEIFNK